MKRRPSVVTWFTIEGRFTSVDMFSMSILIENKARYRYNTSMKNSRLIRQENQKPQIAISVRDFVEFLLKSGDIDESHASRMRPEAMFEGSRLHRKLQNNAGADYHAEVVLRHVISYDAYDFALEGRADGIIYREDYLEELEEELGERVESEKAANVSQENGHEHAGNFIEQADFEEFVAAFKIGSDNGETSAKNARCKVTADDTSLDDDSFLRALTDLESTPSTYLTDDRPNSDWVALTAVTIDEIKGIYQDVRKLQIPVDVHLAQAKCYAYIFAEQHQLDQVGVRLSYCNLDTHTMRYFFTTYQTNTLRRWFGLLAGEYKLWADYLYEHRLAVASSVEKLSFPYPYRNGQKSLVAAVYQGICEEKTEFIQAPTGTGKTLATIYPAVRSLGAGLSDKIFYLTAKTATAVVAIDAFRLLASGGYAGKTVAITAKEKMCLADQVDCDPKVCPYARGHFDRVNDAVYDILQKEEIMDRDCLIDYAIEHAVCPYHFALDASVWVDHIICDYNYAFDPNVALQRYFAEGIRDDYVFLVDEAHNLVERAREMYSETLAKEEFLEAKRLVEPYSELAAKDLTTCNRRFLELRKECESISFPTDIDRLTLALRNAASSIDELLQLSIDIEGRNEILSFYFRVRNFLNLMESYDEHDAIYCDYDREGRFCVHLFCVDPSFQLQQRIDRARSCIFFSATLLPIRYYTKLLTTEKRPQCYSIPSAFLPEQRQMLLGTGVTTTYKNRTDEQYARYARFVHEIVSVKKGNYMVFCPSYALMDEISRRYEVMFGTDGQLLLQGRSMREEERLSFLQEFGKKREESLIAFCVTGGIFSEGIDLTGDRLIGAIIIGVALPQRNHRQDIIQEYFAKHDGDGFAFAYLYPGMNKVIQAAGRVIRTDKDRGVIALLDNRFTYRQYQEAIPAEWADAVRCKVEDVHAALAEFWGE